jgi:hypothetical protein
LQPNAWTKVLPPHFVAARNEAIERAEEWQVEEQEEGEDKGAQLQRQVEEQEEGAFPAPTKTASAGSMSAKSAVDKAEYVDMDAPDPEDPIASPATMLPDVGHFFEEPTPTNHSYNSHSFGEEKKSHEDEFVDAAADPEPTTPPPVDTSMDSMSIDSMKSGEEDFTPIKRDGYTLGNNPTSPASAASSTPSASMRGAQEIIRKKRLKRMEM